MKTLIRSMIMTSVLTLVTPTVLKADSSLIPAPFSNPNVEFKTKADASYRPASVIWYWDAGRTPSAPILVTLPNSAKNFMMKFSVKAINRAGHIVFINSSLISHDTHVPLQFNVVERKILGPYEKKTLNAEITSEELFSLPGEMPLVMFYLDESSQQTRGSVRPKFNRRGLYYSIRFEE